MYILVLGYEESYFQRTLGRWYHKDNCLSSWQQCRGFCWKGFPAESRQYNGSKSQHLLSHIYILQINFLISENNFLIIENQFLKELLRYWPYMPYKGTNFSPRTLGKCFYFVICMFSRHWFQTNFTSIYCLIFGNFGAKMSFFRFIINQKRKIFIKNCSPPVFQNTTYIRDVCLYNKQSV